jgi:phosphatidylinositol alpha-mannosyltransferase
VPGRVTFLGRDERRKGLDILLAAWPSVTARIERAELVVMGASRDQEGIIWMGFVDDETKARTLASASVYVAPNLGGESFGIVMVEAMAAGTPVVASALGSFQAVGGDAVRYFDPADSSQLASVLVGVLCDDLERARMTRAGKERASRFDWVNVAGEYRELYDRAIS